MLDWLSGFQEVAQETPGSLGELAGEEAASSHHVGVEFLTKELAEKAGPALYCRSYPAEKQRWLETIAAAVEGAKPTDATCCVSASLECNLWPPDPESLFFRSSPGFLAFSSCFESGNLEQVYAKSPDEYELLLTNDTNSDGHSLWFYFAVSGMQEGQQVQFTILNFSKDKLIYSEGMQPVTFSWMDGSGWSNTSCCDLVWKATPFKKKSGSCYGTLSFTYVFRHSNDTVYFAYHYPYTYSMLIHLVYRLETVDPFRQYVRRRVLATSLAGVRVVVIVITDWGESPPAADLGNDPSGHPALQKPAVIVTARQHPGESNASWMCHGFIRFIVGDSPEAHKLRQQFCFHVVPCLNPDGVIHGNYRCSLAGVDLNRRWGDPHVMIHPVVYAMKSYIRKIQQSQGAGVYMALDLHGHSKKTGMFFYGCEFKSNVAKSLRLQVYPKLVSLLYPDVVFESCTFHMQRSKSTTARCVMFRELEVPYVYTIESSMYAARKSPNPRDPFANQHNVFNPERLQRLGPALGRGLLMIFPPVEGRRQARKHTELFDDVKQGDTDSDSDDSSEDLEDGASDLQGSPRGLRSPDDVMAAAAEVLDLAGAFPATSGGLPRVSPASMGVSPRTPLKVPRRKSDSAPVPEAKRILKQLKVKMERDLLNPEAWGDVSSSAGSDSCPSEDNKPPEQQSCVKQLIVAKAMPQRKKPAPDGDRSPVPRKRRPVTASNTARKSRQEPSRGSTSGISRPVSAHPRNANQSARQPAQPAPRNRGVSPRAAPTLPAPHRDEVLSDQDHASVASPYSGRPPQQGPTQAVHALELTTRVDDMEDHDRSPMSTHPRRPLKKTHYTKGQLEIMNAQGGDSRRPATAVARVNLGSNAAWKKGDEGFALVLDTPKSRQPGSQGTNRRTNGGAPLGGGFSGGERPSQRRPNSARATASRQAEEAMVRRSDNMKRGGGNDSNIVQVGKGATRAYSSTRSSTRMRYVVRPDDSQRQKQYAPSEDDGMDAEGPDPFSDSHRQPDSSDDDIARYGPRSTQAPSPIDQGARAPGPRVTGLTRGGKAESSGGRPSLRPQAKVGLRRAGVG
mmetsp:Transcript_66276/g.176811  ORF Transcript_66276/g.176811 Transcript_66276/m.176811 type:complete len:1072 (-) Transcript_66276:128-3343(-)